jgi:hypothetical protein
MGKEFNCAACGKSFYVSPTVVAKAKFCSRACRLSGGRSGKEIACVICGKLRYVVPSHVAKAKFCGFTCRSEGYHRNLIGG